MADIEAPVYLAPLRAALDRSLVACRLSCRADGNALLAASAAVPSLRAALDELAVLRAGLAGLRRAVAEPQDAGELLAAARYVLSIAAGEVDCAKLMALAGELTAEQIERFLGALPPLPTRAEIAKDTGLGVDEEVGRG